MIRELSILVVTLLFTFNSWGQEILTGLQYNEAVKHESIKSAEEQKACNCSNETEESLLLPFFDDFSTSSVYADESKWINSKSVFINKDFPYLPPNISAATFDAIDSVGNVYPGATWIPFLADQMTSKPIRLDSVFSPVVRSLTPADSIYLSFYYQPQGKGDEPEPSDTLLLEFARKGDTIFQYIDSLSVSAQFYLENPNDSIKPGDTLSPPFELGCDTSIRWINYGIYTWDDFLLIPCDSVFGPEITWDVKWYAEGMKLDTFYKYNSNKYFVQVMVPLYDSLPDTAYFNDSFQFRFRNYASIANDIIPSWRSNVDQWNVDYVYLNDNRSKDDTAYRVLGFSNRAPSFLQSYQVMPYRQYRSDATNSLRTDFDMEISNLDKIAHNSNYRYKVEQVNGDFDYAFDGGNFNVPPGFYTNVEYVQKLFNIDFTRDTTSYVITHYISDSSESNILVDSAIYRQGFYNYYAYDDGTPEFGYGVEPAGALVAYQFKLSVADTLRGVKMYFNKTKDNANANFFNLMVWKDNNGKPGEVIYRLNSQKPRWENGLYEFHPYMFDTTIIISGTFYVGWQQQTQGSLNIGFDANNFYGYPRTYYKNEQTWYPSAFEGSLLIRPIVGPDMVISDIEEFEFDRKPGQLLIYPNPALNRFSVDLQRQKVSPSVILTIYNIYGSVVNKTVGQIQNINISHLPKGMYVVKVNNEGKILTGKLLINH